MDDCGMKGQDWLLKNLGNRLRQLRQGQRLRQSDMASFGLNEKYYQRLESGQVNPTLLTLYKLAKAFEVSLLSDFHFCSMVLTVVGHTPVWDRMELPQVPFSYLQRKTYEPQSAALAYGILPFA